MTNIRTDEEKCKLSFKFLMSDRGSYNKMALIFNQAYMVRLTCRSSCIAYEYIALHPYHGLRPPMATLHTLIYSFLVLNTEPEKVGIYTSAAGCTYTCVDVHITDMV